MCIVYKQRFRLQHFMGAGDTPPIHETRFSFSPITWQHQPDGGGEGGKESHVSAGSVCEQATAESVFGANEL